MVPSPTQTQTAGRRLDEPRWFCLCPKGFEEEVIATVEEEKFEHDGLDEEDFDAEAQAQAEQRPRCLLKAEEVVPPPWCAPSTFQFARFLLSRRTASTCSRTKKLDLSRESVPFAVGNRCYEHLFSGDLVRRWERDVADVDADVAASGGDREHPGAAEKLRAQLLGSRRRTTASPLKTSTATSYRISVISLRSGQLEQLELPPQPEQKGGPQKSHNNMLQDYCRTAVYRRVRAACPEWKVDLSVAVDMELICFVHNYSSSHNSHPHAGEDSKKTAEPIEPESVVPELHQGGSPSLFAQVEVDVVVNRIEKGSISEVRSKKHFGKLPSEWRSYHLHDERESLEQDEVRVHQAGRQSKKKKNEAVEATSGSTLRPSTAYLLLKAAGLGRRKTPGDDALARKVLDPMGGQGTVAVEAALRFPNVKAVTNDADAQQSVIAAKLVERIHAIDKKGWRFQPGSSVEVRTGDARLLSASEVTGNGEEGRRGEPQLFDYIVSDLPFGNSHKALCNESSGSGGCFGRKGAKASAGAAAFARKGQKHDFKSLVAERATGANGAPGDATREGDTPQEDQHIGISKHSIAEASGSSGSLTAMLPAFLLDTARLLKPNAGRAVFLCTRLHARQIASQHVVHRFFRCVRSKPVVIAGWPAAVVTMDRTDAPAVSVNIEEIMLSEELIAVAPPTTRPTSAPGAVEVDHSAQQDPDRQAEDGADNRLKKLNQRTAALQEQPVPLQRDDVTQGRACVLTKRFGFSEKCADVNDVLMEEWPEFFPTRAACRKTCARRRVWIRGDDEEQILAAVAADQKVAAALARASASSSPDYSTSKSSCDSFSVFFFPDYAPRDPYARVDQESIAVLHAGEEFLAIVKPAGMPVHGGLRSLQNCAHKLCAQFSSERSSSKKTKALFPAADEVPGGVCLFSLPKQVSGVVLVGRSANASLAAWSLQRPAFAGIRASLRAVVAQLLPSSSLDGKAKAKAAPERETDISRLGGMNEHEMNEEGFGAMEKDFTVHRRAASHRFQCEIAEISWRFRVGSWDRFHEQVADYVKAFQQERERDGDHRTQEEAPAGTTEVFPSSLPRGDHDHNERFGAILGTTPELNCGRGRVYLSLESLEVGGSLFSWVDPRFDQLFAKEAKITKKAHEHSLKKENGTSSASMDVGSSMKTAALGGA